MSTINERILQCIDSSGLTKTAFAEKLRVSQQYVSKLTKTGLPSDRTILDICDKFDINEDWLRTGEGEMKVQYSRDEEIAGFIGAVMHGESDNFKRRFIAMLSRLNESDWELLEKMALEMAKEKD